MALQSTHNGMAPLTPSAGLWPFCAGRPRRHAVAYGWALLQGPPHVHSSAR